MLQFSSSNHKITQDKYFTQKELDLLQQSIINDRFGLMCRVALNTGARQSELILLTKDHIDQKNSIILIEATKGSEDRQIKISQDLSDALMALPTYYLFDFSTTYVRQQWYARRPPTIKKSFHCFRHTFGVEMYKATRDIMFCKKALGHKAITSTMVYVECVEYAEKMNMTYLGIDNLINPARKAALEKE
jgi:integrase